MIFDENNAIKARDFLKQKGFLTKEYRKSTNLTKIINDANKLYLDKEFVPLPLPTEEQEEIIKRRKRLQKKYEPHKIVRVKVNKYSILDKRIPARSLTKVMNKLAGIIAIFLMGDGNTYKRFLEKNWKLVEVDENHYEKEINGKLKKKNKNPFLREK